MPLRRRRVSATPRTGQRPSATTGRAAFANEPAAYRDRIADTWDPAKTNFNNAWPPGNWWQFESAIQAAPHFQTLQAQFQKHTQRAWRTWGIPGGMVPWDNGYHYESNAVTLAGTTYRGVNQETLAWIAGPTNDFTDKAKSFLAGQTVSKSAALLNDSAEPLPYTVVWTATLGATPLAGHTHTGVIAVAETLLVPIEFPLPADLPTSKTDGQIQLTALLGTNLWTDTFPFRAFAPSSAPSADLLVWDPMGSSAAMLAALGYATQPWTGVTAPGQLLVVGRDALATNWPAPPASLSNFVATGGRLLLLAQTPATLKSLYGLRVAEHISRRVFRVDPGHAVVAGLDDFDLSDWNGFSTLVPRDTNTVFQSSSHTPTYGWRWGTRHGVCSAPVEKPHHGGWRPLLEGEFDLAYTPLMELDWGSGRVTLCTLDLEDHFAADPAARRLAIQLVEHARSGALAPRVPSVRYLGDDAGNAFLQSLGLVFVRDAAWTPAGAALYVLGNGAAVTRGDLTNFVAAGGRVFVLPGTNAGPGLLGETRVLRTNCVGSLSVPAWPEAAGLSASDLRARAPFTNWVLHSGVPVSADGLLARLDIGGGVVVLSQLDREALRAEAFPYLRFTRWRQTRATTQLLANLGASFASDAWIFQPGVAGPGDQSAAPPATPPAGFSGYFYYPDYQRDFATGDDPYRYYNW